MSLRRKRGSRCFETRIARCTSSLFTLYTRQKKNDNINRYCHAERLPPRPSSPIITAIRGKPRENPDIKSTTWIQERSVLESDEIHEVLLTDDRGRLFEGSQTNVFVVEKDGRIRTANEGILPGTIRNIIVEECKRENIPIDMSPPVRHMCFTCSQYHTHTHSFTTNTHTAHK